MTTRRSYGLAMLLMAVFLLGGCQAAKRKKAANAYKKELRDHRGRFAAFQKQYPSIENRLKELRQKDPKGVVALITKEMLPLLTSLVNGFDPMIKKGKIYVNLLPDSVDAKPRLKKQFAVFRKQQEIVSEIHKTYVDEAALFGKGKPSADDMQQLFNRRIAAARRMQKTSRD